MLLSSGQREKARASDADRSARVRRGRGRRDGAAATGGRRERCHGWWPVCVFWCWLTWLWQRSSSSVRNGDEENGAGRWAGRRAADNFVTGYAEHRASLSEKKKYRRAIKIDLKLPEASTALAGVPRRKDFADGEEGRQAWKAQFNAYAGDFAYSHVGTETVKGRMGAVGLWGDYCEREGHGKYVEWLRKETDTLKKIVLPVRDVSTG